MASTAEKLANGTTPARHKFRLTRTHLEFALLGLLLFAATIAAYYPVRNFPYLDYDDAKYVTDNPHIQDGLTLDTISWAFTHGYAANYHPLTWISHALDIQLFALDASVPHLENVVLHAINALLLFWVLWRATGYLGRSWMVAALFALHPINVESVAWVAERKTLLSTFFFFLALGAYRWYVSRPGVRRYAIVALLFVLGLWCKPQIITLPFVFLLWDYWPLRRMTSAPAANPDDPVVAGYPTKSFSWLLKEKIPLFIICLVDAGLTMVAQGAASNPQYYSLFLRLENALVSYIRYIGKAFWPASLVIMYPHPIHSVPWWQTAGALLFLAAITLLAVRTRHHRPYLLVGWLWFLGTLVPMIGLVQVDVQAMADRYAYISLIGIFLTTCWGIADLAQERHVPQVALAAVSVLVLLALTFVTHRQVNYWSDDLTLWTHTMQLYPERNWKGEYFLGSALEKRGHADEAIPHFFRAEAIFHGDPDINLKLAIYQQQQNNLPQAIDYYKKVLATSGNVTLKTQVMATMAQLYVKLGDLENAHRYLSVANDAARAKAMDWQGEWWKQIGPQLQAWWSKRFSSGH